MYKNILIATDGSKLATQGLAHGLALAKAQNTPVTIVTTTEIWPTLEMAAEAENKNKNPILDYEKSMATFAKKILASAEESAKQAGVSCECVHVTDRHPAEGILETASSKGCDLIVLSSHGLRGIKKALLGSVASEVLADSKVPVLIVK